MTRLGLAAAAFVLGFGRFASADQPPPHPLPPSTDLRFSDLPGLAADDLAAAFAVFRASCTAVDGAVPPSRAAAPPPPALRHVCRVARTLPSRVTRETARGFFATHFSPRQLTNPAFFTGYYEPVVDGSLTRTAEFATPLLALPGGSASPMPDRAGIETGALGVAAKPLVWVREPVDAFFIQVQGSARIRLPNGALRRVAYAGRNGYPYTSIGKVLVDTLHIPPAQMGMAELKAWVRAHGEGPGDAGTQLMRENRSYIFFRFDDSLPPDAGPVGAAGVSLTALRSLAVDRSVWPYGLPFYVAAEMPWQSDAATPLDRLMVAQDTGSAILGATRADIFFGSGPEAAARAGPIRHPGTLFVLWPKDRPRRPRRPDRQDRKAQNGGGGTAR